MGILASHVPSIEQLRPGVVEVIEGAATKKFFGNYPILEATKEYLQDKRD
jgi:F0F1-type ATP synthase epsilon subunit